MPNREAWIVDYVDTAGERHITTFDRKKEADSYTRACGSMWVTGRTLPRARA